MAEVRPWLADVRHAARAEGGFGRGEGAARTFDAAWLDETSARLERSLVALGGRKPLRELLGDAPDTPVEGFDPWQLYEDLVRTWTALVSPPWTERDLTGDGGLLARLSDAVGRDLRLARESAYCKDVGMPYPVTWRKLPRARIHHVSHEYLDALWEIGNAEAARAADALGRPLGEVRAQAGDLLRHFDRARTLDTVVAVLP